MISINDTLFKLYFHEIEARDRIFNRLQFHFAIYASAIALLAYMARMVDYESSCIVLTLFYTGLAAGVALLTPSIYYTLVSLTGYEYKTLPKANEIVRYDSELRERSESLKKYNQEYDQDISIPNPNKEINKYLSEAFSECIDYNYSINEYRRQLIRKSIWSMILAAIPVLCSAFLFIYFDLDASSPRKIPVAFMRDRPIANSLEKIEKSILLFPQQNLKKEMSIMSDEHTKQDITSQNKKTPPPPPPEPVKPNLQISTEDFKAPIPNKEKIINESKK